MKRVLLIALLAMLPMLGHAEPKPVNQRPIKVAFAISQHVNVMDVAGPWEVFADTSIKDAQGKNVSPYELYTVAANTTPLHSEGANHPGLTITPDYDFAQATQRTPGSGYSNFLRRQTLFKKIERQGRFPRGMTNLVIRLLFLETACLLGEP